ncbi:flagellar hook-basal body complex protein FliE [Glycocaulis sp.]|uniref:flagellar hook-basal body complex protein FliE n=1 Tax=Glycocaulis sp. TaxID=1969725 RepID=UPI003D1E15A1
MDLAAIRAYAQAARQVSDPNATSAASAGNPVASGFGDMVMNALSETQAVMQASESLTAQNATGQAELVDVVTAMAAAEVQLETVIAVRDQVIRAYQEILRMPI